VEYAEAEYWLKEVRHGDAVGVESIAQCRPIHCSVENKTHCEKVKPTSHAPEQRREKPLSHVPLAENPRPFNWLRKANIVETTYKTD
jgi:hypothetical protein